MLVSQLKRPKGTKDKVQRPEGLQLEVGPQGGLSTSSGLYSLYTFSQQIPFDHASLLAEFKLREDLQNLSGNFD